VRRPNLSLNEFKNWISQQPDLSNFFDISDRLDPVDEFAGRRATSKVSEQKLMQRIRAQEGEAELLVADFIEHGGVVLSAAGKEMLIEVEEGSFFIPRFCLRLQKG
jgi:hypothetical protein